MKGMLLNMNAYEFLKVDDLLDYVRFATTSRVFDATVKTRTKRKLWEGIHEINNILSSAEPSIAKKLSDIDAKLKELRKIAVAYDDIATPSSRQAHNGDRDFDINEVFEEMDSILENAFTFASNGKTESAFQILDLSSNNDRGKEPREQDATIRHKVYHNVNLALANSKLDSIDDFEDLITDLTRYMWAYSKIGDFQQRETYRYKNIARCGDEASKGMGTIQMRALDEKDQQQCTIEFPEDERYDTIRISKVGAVRSDEIQYYDTKGYVYAILKERANTDNEKPDYKKANKAIPIVSNIDMVRMNNDVQYRTRVEEELLSDEAIRSGKRYLGGYVGELDENGEKTFSVECVGMCRAWERILNAKRAKRAENARRGKENPIASTLNTKGNRTTSTNPDTDDDSDRELN